MTIHADTLIDRIRLKTQVTRWRLIAIGIAVLAVIILAEPVSDMGPIRGNYIARITVNGIVNDDRDVSKMIQDLEDDDYARAVIVWIDTPGGSAVGGQQMYLDLRKLASKKPVVAVMRSMATSAGYMLALGADRIYAREGTITGSIGVIMQMAEFTELAKKLGITPITVKSGEFKATPSPFEKYTPRQEAVMQAVIQNFFRWFVEMVAERRKLPIDTVTGLADGRVYTGRQALELKLVDQLGGEDEAMDWLAKNRQIDATLEIEDVEPKREVPGLFEEFSQAAAKTLVPSALRLDGLISIWHPNAL